MLSVSVLIRSQNLEDRRNQSQNCLNRPTSYIAQELGIESSNII